MGRKINSSLWFWLGIFGMILTMVPEWILGEQSIVAYHDQLDGEMIAYILQAKHLFSGKVLPEFMGGMPKTALTMPAPVCVILFLGGNYFVALEVMKFTGRLAGFVGMYLLARKMTGNDWAAAAAGILYGLLPFLPVYGLSQYGIPLLFWCALMLREKKHTVLACGYVVLYGLASSLVLVGFGLLGMGLLIILRDLARKEKKPYFVAAWWILAGVYVVENLGLLLQIMGFGDGSVSHKAEYRLNAQPFWGTFWQSLLYGGQHSNGYQKFMLLVLLMAVIAVAAAEIVRRSHEENRNMVGSSTCEGRTGNDVLEGGSKAGNGNAYTGENGCNVDGARRILKCMGGCLGWNCFFAAVAALWGSSAGVELRSFLGALGAFQLDRLLWIAPCLWYLAAACGLAVLWNLWMEQGRGRKVLAGGCLLISLGATAITGIWILYSGDMKSNIQKLRNPEYHMLSYHDYYAVGVMEQVRDFLEEETGEGQEAYRVVSLGIDPAAALYHGFYCLDGYSNNYSLAYKHKFREIIRPELEKSEYLADYFDNWGNRCYLFSAECPGYYTIEKNGFCFQAYEVNGEALQEMGCRYLLSAAYIQNADSQGLTLMREQPFDTKDSYYQIYVYEVMGSAGKTE